MQGANRLNIVRNQACEEDVGARLVIHWEGLGEIPKDKKAWEVRTGPFDEETFSSLPETHYSLLVMEVSSAEFADLVLVLLCLAWTSSCTNVPLSRGMITLQVNKWVSELDELMACFNFIPNWRMDDLMVSYAAEGGGVGPHVDNYDVFLLQVYHSSHSPGSC